MPDTTPSDLCLATWLVAACIGQQAETIVRSDGSVEVSAPYLGAVWRLRDAPLLDDVPETDNLAVLVDPDWPTAVNELSASAARKLWIDVRRLIEAQGFRSSALQQRDVLSFAEARGLPATLVLELDGSRTKLESGILTCP